MAKKIKPTSDQLSRRDFIMRGGAVVGGLALAPSILSNTGAFAAQAGNVGGKLSVLNWPLYIDEEAEEQFKKATGINLKYSEALNDNNEFFAKYQEPLSKGSNVGFDIAMPTSWMANRLLKLGYLQKLPLTDAPNVANLSPGFQSPAWDPSGEYTLPWQTGMTGLAYNIKVTGRELTSANDLFDPKFKGKVGMLSEMRDTVGLTLLGDGVDPATVTYKQARPSMRKLQKAADNGQIRRFTGNDYQDDLVSGDFAVCVGWSGDVAQLVLENEDLRFVIPDEGGMRFADVMVWVKGSKAKAQVAAWLDYFYTIDNAAQLEAFIQYISPVAGIQPALAALNPAAAKSELIFPPESVEARLKTFKILNAKEEEQFDNAFAKITGS